MNKDELSIGVVGGGAWGTAIAQSQAVQGRNVLLWAREEDVVNAINVAHENKPFLSGIALHEGLKATSDSAQIMQQDIVVMVTPAQYLRASLETLKAHLKNVRQPIVIASKGIEIATGQLLSDIAAEILPENPITILTGPTFASEVAKNLPAAITLASKNIDDAKYVQDALGTPYFRPYLTDDVIGTQLGSALKNVIAIAAGMSTGQGLGESARAALITRGLAEISRLCKAMGGQEQTLLGMCGVGDMILTCSSMESRNFSLGARLGAGEALEQILGSRSSVTEGVHTARAALKLGEKYHVEMPICQAVFDCLDGKKSVPQSVEYILSRPFKA